MEYVHSDLGTRRRGDVVQFNLSGNQANIALLDSPNYSAFRNGRRFRGVIAKAIASPAHLTVPSGGHWHAVVYLPYGYTGTISASIGIL